MSISTCIFITKLERTLTHICPAYSDQCLQPTLYKQTIMVQYKRMYKNSGSDRKLYELDY